MKDSATNGSIATKGILYRIRYRTIGVLIRALRFDAEGRGDLLGKPAARITFYLIRILARTLRYEFDDRACILDQPQTRPYLFAVWHNRVLLIPYIGRRFFPSRKARALISASKDGALIADLVTRFGFPAVLGSSSRHGASAVLQAKEIIDGGEDVVITPDGPRGPVYVIGPGIVFLAQKTGAPVVPTSMEYSRCWRIKSWDNFFVPKPFSRVRVIFGGLHEVQMTATDAEFESERLRLQDAMMQLVKMK